MIVITKVSFVLTLVHTIDGVKSKPRTPRGTKFVNLHEDIPREVNNIFASQPSNSRKSGSNPPRPLGPWGCFGLPIVNLSRPPLPPNRPYRWPFNHLEYVKDSNPNVHVKIFKTTIRANNETDDEKFVSLFCFTLIDIMFNWCNNYMGNYPNYIFAVS